MKHFNPQNNSPIDQASTVFWFRRDLRLQDNAGLYYALTENKSVVPIFIFDTTILDNLEDKADKRVEFIHNSLTHLQQQLVELGSSLIIFHGDPIAIFESLKPKTVYTNHDYEPYAKERDEVVKNGLQTKSIGFKT